MMKKPIQVFSVVFLLLIAGCLGATPAVSSTGTGPTDDGSSSISVGATGTVAVEPDVALVTVVVEASSNSADEARQQVADDVSAVRTALTELGLDDDAVTTASFHLQPEYDYSGDNRELLGYRAVHALSVEAGVDQAGAVIDAAVGAGADRIQGVQFTLTDEHRQTARQEALTAAMGHAEADAGAIAAAADLTIDGVQSVSTGAPTVTPFEGRLEMAADAGGSTTIDSGPVTVSAHVNVVYRVQ